MYIKLLSKIKQQIMNVNLARQNYYANAGSTSLQKHIIVFQSDDWGSIRTSSRNAFENICKRDESSKNHPFLRVDCLESSDDIKKLHTVLAKHEITKENKPVITMNFATANPDFNAMKSDRSSYHNESFLVTYKKYYGDILPFQSIITGIEEGVFHPQLHCREHLNFTRWIKDLEYDKSVQLAFQYDMTGVGASKSEYNANTYQDSCNYDDKSELILLEDMLRDAAEQFKNAFGFESISFVAPCFIWDSEIERILLNLGIKYMQTGLYQQVAHNKGTYKMEKLRHYSFEENRSGMTYLVRNCSFEPLYTVGNSIDRDVENCIKQIQYAFSKNKPAIVDSHRANYIGQINPDIQARSLEGLDILLRDIIKFFPDVVFMSTEQLIKYYESMQKTGN